MNSRWTLAAAGLLIATATAAGAFGAHALQGELSPKQLGVYDTAVKYQFYHALGLLGIGLAARIRESAGLRAAAGLILGGILLFAGSLYALTFGAPRQLGIVTPLGGILLIAGWLVFAVTMLRDRSTSTHL